MKTGAFPCPDHRHDILGGWWYVFQGKHSEIFFHPASLAKDLHSKSIRPHEVSLFKDGTAASKAEAGWVKFHYGTFSPVRYA